VDQFNAANNLLGRLVKLDARKSNVVPDIAESWTESMYGSDVVVDFKLRESYFSMFVDGKLTKGPKITAQVVVDSFYLFFAPSSTGYSAKYVAAPTIKGGSEYMAGETSTIGVERVADDHVKITLNGSPVAWKEKMTLMHIFDSSVATHFSGPYALASSLTEDREMVYVANPFHHSASKDRADRVVDHRLGTVTSIKEEKDYLLTEAFATGAYDATATCASGITLGNEFPELVKHKVRVDTGLSVFWGLSTKAFGEDSLLLRKAVSKAMRYDESAVAAHAVDKWTATNQFTPKGYTSRPDPTGDSVAYTNLAEANEFLDQYMTLKGITDKSTIHVNACSRSAPSPAADADLMTAVTALRQLGISSDIVRKLEPTPGLTYPDRIECFNSTDAHLVFFGWLPDYNNAYNYVGDMLTYVIDSYIGKFYTKPPAYVSSLAAAKAASTAEEMATHLAAAQKAVIHDDPILLPWFTGSTDTLQRSYMAGSGDCSCSDLTFSDLINANHSYASVKHIQRTLRDQ
jgi:ABC-type oligopeptide transport system substrate-binding subunit